MGGRRQSSEGVDMLVAGVGNRAAKGTPTTVEQQSASQL